MSWWNRKQAEPQAEQPSQPAQAPAAVDPLAGFTDDEVFTAALNIVGWIACPSDSFWGGTMESIASNQRQLDEQRRAFDDRGSVRLRRAAEEWFEFSQRRIDEARLDVMSGRHRREHEEYVAKKRKEDARARDATSVIRSLPLSSGDAPR